MHHTETEFEREIERIKREAAKAEENRLKLEQALQEAQDQIICLRASAELEKSKMASLGTKKSEHMTQLEELKAGYEDSTQQLLKEINELKSRNQALETKVAQSETENVQLKEKLESDCNHYGNELRVMEVQQTTLANEHETQVQNLNTEAREYKRKFEEIEVRYAELQVESERIPCLETKVAQSETENVQLKEKLESDCNHYGNELRVMEVQQTTLANEHETQVQNLNTEAREYKRKFEEIEVRYAELQVESDRIHDKLETEVRQTLIQKCDSNDEFLGRATEMEHKNSVLAEQFAVVKQDNQASQEEIASLKFQMEVLKEEKLQSEWRLGREKQKSQRRKDEAKDRRKKFKDSLQGFQETLKDDLVEMSYSRGATAS